MKSRTLPRCCFCAETISPSDFRLVLDEPGGSKVALGWHHPCAETDPLHLDLAGSLSLQDDEAGEDATARAYLALLDRIATRGAEVLRAAVDVRRDLPDLRVTLRGPGLSWGRRSSRL